MTPFVPGPTYEEMQKPWTLPAEVRQRAAIAALQGNELDPANLFNINWYSPEQDRPTVRKIVLPPAFTGVSCNIVVLLADGFPSSSHHVGPAYSILAEAEVDGRLHPGTRVIAVGPVDSVIAAAYVSRLKGYRAVAILPDNLSDACYEQIRNYGSDLELIPGGASVAAALEHAHRMKEYAPSFLLSPYEDLSGYRFHRHVTGTAAVEACRDLGDGRIAAFVGTPGAAGTLAAGDQIRQQFPDCTVIAAEPREGGTLSVGVPEPHRIDQGGQLFVSLIHNVLITDYIVTVDSEYGLRGLRLLHEGADWLQSRFDLDAATAAALAGSLGIAGVCNLIAAIKMARRLDMPVDANVVTIADGSHDSYPSAQASSLASADAPIDQNRTAARYEEVFLGSGGSDLLDVGTHAQKDRLSEAKRALWTRFGYPDTLFDSMMRQSFWETEYEKAFIYNQRIRRYREEHGGLELA